MMTEPLSIILAGLAGGALGAMFFGGLWWTVRKGLSSKQPAILFLTSLILRTIIVLAGFHFVAAGHWIRLLACLLGFVIFRFIVIRVTHWPAGRHQTPPMEADDASEP